MIANKQAAALKAAAELVQGWANCNMAWIDTSEDTACAVVGHIDEDGSEYPVSVVDCDQYYSGDSLKLAKFYAIANPATILSLLAERDALIARLEAAERDAKLLDWIESQGNSMTWLARQSLTGRGFRLHQDREGTHATAREAISAAMQQEGGE